MFGAILTVIGIFLLIALLDGRAPISHSPYETWLEPKGSHETNPFKEQDSD